jgi:hypothetical protein
VAWGGFRISDGSTSPDILMIDGRGEMLASQDAEIRIEAPLVCVGLVTGVRFGDRGMVVSRVHMKSVIGDRFPARSF